MYVIIKNMYGFKLICYLVFLLFKIRQNIKKCVFVNLLKYKYFMWNKITKTKVIII